MEMTAFQCLFLDHPHFYSTNHWGHAFFGYMISDIYAKHDQHF